jgi:uncharacterized protein (TIGR03000 family)
MVKKLALLATVVVATVCCAAPRAQAGLAHLAVFRWHRHFWSQADHVGWDYASRIGHGTWGSHPLHWAGAIVYSARPWPAVAERATYMHFDGRWHVQLAPGYEGGHHGRRGHGRRGHGHHRHHRHHGWQGGYGYGDAAYDDANGMIYDRGWQGGVGGEGPGVEYDPRVTPKKEGELVEPPAGPKKTAAPTTKLVLNVPAEAKVILAGVDTMSYGGTREFVTSLLNGSAWTDYSVRVELKRDGQTLVDERTVTLHPGDNQQITIDFSAAQVASK